MEWVKRQLECAMYQREPPNYFYFLHPFRVIAGYPANLRSTSARLGMAVRFTTYLVYLASLVHKLTYTLYQPEDINYISFVGGTVGVLTGYLILLALGTRHCRYFRKLENFFNDRSFARHHPQAAPIRQRCYRWSNCFILLPQAGVLLVNVQLLVLRQFTKKHMMLVVRGEPIGNDVSHALYGIILYLPSVGLFMACAMVNACLMGFYGEMKLLAICLGELDETVAHRLANQDGERPRNCFWTAYNAELQRCARRHCLIFTMLKQMQQFSSFVFLLHHVFSLALVVAGTYVTLRANALRENIIFTEYPIPLILMYFIFCMLVEKIQDVNNTIGDRLYATEWMLQLRYSREFHREYRSAVRTIAILLGRSQQRIRFTCGSINEVSMAKFTDFINLNYTFVMFLINMN